MRKTAFVETTMLFGERLRKENARGLKPSLRFGDGEISYQKKEGKLCITQDFKGRAAYLQLFDLVLDEAGQLPIKIKQSDLYLIYLLKASQPIQLFGEKQDHLASLSGQRALFLYLPAGNYQLHLPAGNYQLFGLCFDVGIFDSGADTGYDFLVPLLDAHRCKTPLPMRSPDFRICQGTKRHIYALCRKLKKADLDTQVNMMLRIKELIERSKTNLLLETQSDALNLHYVELAKSLIEAGVDELGMGYALSELGEEIPMNLKYFGQIFKQNTRYTLEGYRQQCATERAKTLLLDGMAIWKVSIIMGYSEARSFRRFFKANTGLTPQEFQQNPIDLEFLIRSCF